MPMTFACPAKINLTLEVLGRRDDGYHALRSVMVPLELADELQIEPAGTFAFACSDPVAREATTISSFGGARALEPLPDCEVDAAQDDPDASRVGRRIERRRRRPARRDGRRVRADAYAADWLAIARSLGSDVPFFLVGFRRAG